MAMVSKTATSATTASPRSTLVVAALLCASAAAAATLAYFAYRSSTSSSATSFDHANSRSVSSRTDSDSRRGSRSRSRKKSAQQNKNSMGLTNGTTTALTNRTQLSKLTRISSDSEEFATNLSRLMQQASDTAYCTNLSDEKRANLAEELKNHGNVYYKEMKYDDAINVYTLAVQLCPEIPVLYSNRSACYNALQKYDEAIADSTIAIEKKPTLDKPYFRRANAYYAVKNYKQAFFDFMTVSILQSFKDDKITGMVEKTIQASALEMIEQEKLECKVGFQSLFVAQQTIFSITDLKYDWLKDHEDDETNAEHSAEAHFARAVNFIHNCQIEEAFVELELAQSLVPSKDDNDANVENTRYSDIVNLYAALCILSKRDSEARSALERAQVLFGSSLNPFNRLLHALIALEENDNTKAIEIFNAVMEQFPDNHFVVYQCAQACNLVGEINRAIELFDRARKICPDFAFAYIQHAVALYRMGDRKACLEIFGEAFNRFPRSAEVLHYYGEILLDLEDAPGAKSAFERALVLNPKMVTSYVNLSYIAQLQLDFKTAEKQLRTAYEVDPNVDTTIIQLGTLLAQQNRQNDAMKMFKRLTKIARTKNELVSYCIAILRTEADVESTRRLGRKTIEHCINMTAKGN